MTSENKQQGSATAPLSPAFPPQNVLWFLLFFALISKPYLWLKLSGSELNLEFPKRGGNKQEAEAMPD